MEARLLYNKPTYAFGDSWFTGHSALVVPVTHAMAVYDINMEADIKEGMEHLQEYRLWFLGQLLARQHKRSPASSKDFEKWVRRRSYKSYLEHGEDVFGFEGTPY